MLMLKLPQNLGGGGTVRRVGSAVTNVQKGIPTLMRSRIVSYRVGCCRQRI